MSVLCAAEKRQPHHLRVWVRQELEDSMGRPMTVDSLIRNMLNTAEMWKATSTFAAEVMLELGRAEEV